MISFLAVNVISKVYLGVYVEKQQKPQEEDVKEAGEGGGTYGNS